MYNSLMSNYYLIKGNLLGSFYKISISNSNMHKNQHFTSLFYHPCQKMAYSWDYLSRNSTFWIETWWSNFGLLSMRLCQLDNLLLADLDKHVYLDLLPKSKVGHQCLRYSSIITCVFLHAYAWAHEIPYTAYEDFKLLELVPEMLRFGLFWRPVFSQGAVTFVYATPL